MAGKGMDEQEAGEEAVMRPAPASSPRPAGPADSPPPGSPAARRPAGRWGPPVGSRAAAAPRQGAGGRPPAAGSGARGTAEGAAGGAGLPPAARAGTTTEETPTRVLLPPKPSRRPPLGGPPLPSRRPPSGPPRPATQTGPEPAERTAPAPPRYWPGLDGMRAIAVAAVVLFHMEPNWLPGGFFGVDLFFVISGYLITSLL